MEPIFRDLEPIKPRVIPTMTTLPYVEPRGWTGKILSDIITQPILDVTEPIRRREIDPDMALPGIPQPYPADEDLMPPLDISVPKALPGGLKMWHLLVALGVLFWMKKR